MVDSVLYHDKDRVRVGGVVRYDLELISPQIGESLFLRVRNTESVALRAAYLNGPYTIYCDMVPMNYSEYEAVEADAEPKYENHVKASSHFSAELKVQSTDQKWRVTIESEILFSRTAEVNFEITVGTSKKASKLYGKHAESSQGSAGQGVLRVHKYDTAAIWQHPLPRTNESLHICVLTHGLVSNVTADMLYIKELIDDAARRTGENLICKGYTGNVCRTEKGVKYLGKRLADWVVDELIPTYEPSKLSFVSHSLGGLIQTYALGYIQAHRSDALAKIELVNFVALASPFMGISNENPGYVQFALNFGVVGITGLDLGLSHIPGVNKPLLEQIPNDATLTILRRFRNRTVYANAVNDGIVPLRTASLLYLDWRAIGNANAAQGDYHRRKLHRTPQRQGNAADGIKISGIEAKLMHQEKVERTAKKAAHPEDLTDEGDNSASSKDSLLPSLADPSITEPEKVPYPLDVDAVSGGDQHSKSTPALLDQESNEYKPDQHSISPMESVATLTRDNPVSTFLFGPSKHNKILKRSQTVGVDDGLDDVGESLPKKTSLIESGMSLLLPPHPDREFITDPAARENVIFHDRVYHPEDLPERRFKSRLHLLKGYKEKVEVAKTEERIARSYHSGASWRKVLVEMMPEAHNNIIVRRRFSNAYGWPVVHHLVREHFLFPEEASNAEAPPNNAINSTPSQVTRPENQQRSSSSGGPGELRHKTSELSLGSNDSSGSGDSKNNPWAVSDDSNEADPEKDFDPQRVSMLKIIPKQ